MSYRVLADQIEPEIAPNSGPECEVAIRHACAAARNAEEARMFIEMLGLTPSIERVAMLRVRVS